MDSGAATPNSDFTLQPADGTRFAAYGARATRPTGAGMLVLPDVRGLHTNYKELALRFAEVGVDAVAIDFFGRTDKSGDRSDAFEYFPHLVQTKPGTLQADIAARVAYLRSKEGGHARALFSVGFCFGGALSEVVAPAGFEPAFWLERAVSTHVVARTYGPVATCGCHLAFEWATVHAPIPPRWQP
jgi:dienelactone hydrolase